ncbi:MAG TPA: TonB-dependent siderophore receptor [Gemmatimonadaceae bacterium]|nr:TonB-dependent siderophore receptor [Gemmatimonadaceae bacterium]
MLARTPFEIARRSPVAARAARLARLGVVAALTAAATARAASAQGATTPPRTAADSAAAAAARAADSTRRVEKLAIVTVRAARATPAAVGYQARRSRSATRTDTPLRDVPQSISVVTPTLIRDQGMQGMADVTRYVPGVTMGQGEGNRDQPTIRGNGSTSDFFVDGLRDDVEYFRDLYNADRVEVLKGPNAMAFGRGGGGGVINRVGKEAGWTPVRSLSLQGGAYDERRATLDVGQGAGAHAAGRLNAMYEHAASYREHVGLERYGVNPTVTLAPGSATTVRVGYELFDDHRTADRGVPSFRGRPLATGVATFFGDPSQSYADARIQSGTVMIDHALGAGFTVRNATRLAGHQKFYQNVYPGAVDSTATRVSLLGYNNRMRRTNLLNQTDVTYSLRTGTVGHLLLGGAELSRQSTSAFRNTGYFGDAGATSLPADVSAPTVDAPVAFRQSATDADAHTTATVAAAYVQDQLELSKHLQAIAGVRVDRFDLRYHNNRNGADLARRDRMVSPRLGVVVKPVEALSLYTSYAVSHLPGSGNQFSSLTVTSKTLAPERFTNYEVGAKWDATAALSLTSALYRLDRTNTSAPDPADPTHVVQTGSQRSSGFELGASGSVTSRWQVMAGYGHQNVEIRSATTAARAGATVALTPRHALSLWNRFQPTRALGVGVGVVSQSRMFAAIDDRVVLPAFTRVDMAAYWTILSTVRAQVNVENVFDRTYYLTASGNNNITPASPRAVRASLTAGF